MWASSLAALTDRRRRAQVGLAQPEDVERVAQSRVDGHAGELHAEPIDDGPGTVVVRMDEGEQLGDAEFGERRVKGKQRAFRGEPPAPRPAREAPADLDLPRVFRMPCGPARPGEPG